MAEPVYRVEGGRTLRRTLREAGSDLQELRDAHQQAADIAARAAVALAPERSGDLRNNIRAAGTKTAGIVRAGNNTSLQYAGPVHWGWPTRPNAEKGWRGGPINPNTFMVDGAEQSRHRWEPIYERAVERAIANVKGV